MKILENLAKEDLQLLIDTPVLITILIGGADGTIDKDEIAWGDKLTHIRATTDNSFLQDYYKLAADRFDERFKAILDTFSNDHEERNETISEILSNLNTIYKDIDNNFVEELNKSFRSFAHQIAESSGGILGFGAESYQEHQWVDLAMIKK